MYSESEYAADREVSSRYEAHNVDRRSVFLCFKNCRLIDEGGL